MFGSNKMKIESGNLNKKIEAGDIKIGECFVHNHTLFMRTNDFSILPGNVGCAPVRVVQLSTGKLNGFLETDKVESINTKVVIETITKAKDLDRTYCTRCKQHNRITTSKICAKCGWGRGNDILSEED